MDHLGIDVHKKESQICILADGGELSTPSAPGGTGPGPTPPRGPSPTLAGPVAAIQSSRQDSP
jgi:hypothetical protein